VFVAKCTKKHNGLQAENSNRVLLITGRLGGIAPTTAPITELPGISVYDGCDLNTLNRTQPESLWHCHALKRPNKPVTMSFLVKLNFVFFLTTLRQLACDLLEGATTFSGVFYPYGFRRFCINCEQQKRRMR
jgi:hypothetical protein